MSSLIQKIYWRLPSYFKNVVASVNAIKLDKERYNKHFYEISKQIVLHNTWSSGQFKNYQVERLGEVIKRASLNVPYYRELFCAKGIRVEDIRNFEDLRKLPVLEKSVIREYPESLLDETLDRNKLMRCSTSGTTGTPLRLYRTRYLNAAVFAFIEGRNHAIAGMQRRVNRSVSIGGHLVTAPSRNCPPFWVYNKRWNQLYMSSYHLSSAYLGYYVEALRDFKADYIEGYPSSVYAIARYILDNKLEPVPFNACFTTAETLFDYHREAIKKAFCCRTYDQYGCGEQVIFAAECNHGSMHLSPEVGIVEVVDDKNRPVPVGQTGQLICTSLINYIQLFIRYRLGDIGSLNAGQCPCGSPLPMLGIIEGRTDDVLITRDGRRIGRLDPVFKGTRGIVEAQIIQDDYSKFRIRIVPAKDHTKADNDIIVKNLSERVGIADIKIEIVGKIERTKSGKFRAVICNLPKTRGT